MRNLPPDVWEQSEYSRKEYEAEPVTDNLVSAVEAKLGYRLPVSYVALMQTQNGGLLTRTCHGTTQRTSWAHDHVGITGIYGISESKPNSLCGELGSQFWIDEWGYPPIGVYFADCPSDGHDMICLDYSVGGPSEEPRVVHVDQELDYRVTVLADTFEEFLLGLQPAENFSSD